MPCEPDNLYREILDSITDSFYAVDGDWHITYLNPRIEQVWQRRREDLIGAGLWDIFPQFRNAPGSQAIERAMAERVPVCVEVVSPFLHTWVEINAQPLPSGGLAVSFRDITARKQAEEGLRQARAELEQRVEERTAELLQRNRELDEFAYAASHDLRAPLRGIRNLAEWIQQDTAGILPAESAAHLARLQGRIQRMDHLLTGLLAYSRAGRQRHEVEQIDVAELARSVFDLVNPPPGFCLLLEEPLPVFMGERVPLETILRNLIDNAAKHHDNVAAGRVTVAAVTKGDWIEFAVSDDGPGIDPEYHDRIFHIFQTLVPRDQIEGSGIGLSLVKKLVESRGGEITVESSLKHGATFRFTWPAQVTSPA